MRLFSRATVVTALLVSTVGAPAAAQSWKWDLGINGGYSWFTKMLDAEETGLPDGTGMQNVKFKAGPLVGGQFTYWFGPKFGIRANLRYADNGVTGSDMEGVQVVPSVNLWGGTGDLMIRLKAPAAEFTKMEMLPYLALGVGGKWHNPAGDGFNCVDDQEDKEWACAPFLTGPRQFALGEQKVLAGLIGLGADWRLSRTMAIRTELSDQIFKPQIYTATRVGVTNTFNLPAGDENVAHMVHELGVQLGLHFLFGVPRPVVVAVEPTPAPPPPPPPVQPTPPPPAPREDAITVCVIDPTVPGGIRMENAIYRVTQRDTMVTVNGQRVPLRNAVGNVMVASNADWYVRGQPLTMTVSGERMEFVTYGNARMVEGRNLGFLGTINGVPVYADRDDVRDVIEELNELNRAQRGADLAKILEEHKDLRDELADVKLLYVPLQATGCVFQAVQRQEQVRKNREF